MAVTTRMSCLRDLFDQVIRMDKGHATCVLVVANIQQRLHHGGYLGDQDEYRTLKRYQYILYPAL